MSPEPDVEDKPGAGAKRTPKVQGPYPPTGGLAIASDFWLWAALLLYAPRYLNIRADWHWPFELLGFIFLMLSLAFTLTELGRLWKTEALSYWGVSLVFLLPALGLHLAITNSRIAGLIASIGRVGVLLLAAIGFPMLFQGVPYLFWRKEDQGTAGKTASAPVSEPRERPSAKSTLEVVANVAVALLALATAIVTLVEALVPGDTAGN